MNRNDCGKDCAAPCNKNMLEKKINLSLDPISDYTSKLISDEFLKAL